MRDGIVIRRTDVLRGEGVTGGGSEVAIVSRLSRPSPCGRAALFGIALAAAAPAAAQDAAPTPNPAPAVDLGKDRVTIGIGGAVVPSYIGSDHYLLLPGIAVQGQVHGMAFNTQGTSLYVDLIPGDGKPGWKLQAGPQATLRLDRNSLVNDRQVEALGTLHKAVELGGWIGVQRTGVVTSPYDSFSISASYQYDVANAHRSYVASPSISYATPLSHKLYVSLTGGADYVGRGFGGYYYDVSAAGAAASGLAAYGGADHAGWKDWNSNLLVARSLTGDLTHGLGLFATGGYSRLLGRYARSPIVADAGTPRQWSGGLGLAYTF